MYLLHESHWHWRRFQNIVNNWCCEVTPWDSLNFNTDGTVSFCFNKKQYFYSWNAVPLIYSSEFVCTV
jgi:hypothetical protein